GPGGHSDLLRRGVSRTRPPAGGGSSGDPLRSLLDRYQEQLSAGASLRPGAGGGERVLRSNRRQRGQPAPGGQPRRTVQPVSGADALGFSLPPRRDPVGGHTQYGNAALLRP